MLVELEEGKRLPYKPEITAAMLPYIRGTRNLNQSEFSKVAGITQSALSLLEAGKRPLTERYTKAIRTAITRLRISNEELVYITRMIKIKKSRGYK